MIDLFLVHLTGFLSLLTCTTMMVVGVLKDYESCSRRVFPGGNNENRESVSWCCVRADDRTQIFVLFCP
jgi:hypothetical protein